MATTKVCKIEIAELKKAIYYLGTGFLSDFIDRDKKRAAIFP